MSARLHVSSCSLGVASMSIGDRQGLLNAASKARRPTWCSGLAAVRCLGCRCGSTSRVAAGRRETQDLGTGRAHTWRSPAQGAMLRTYRLFEDRANPRPIMKHTIDLPGQRYAKPAQQLETYDTAVLTESIAPMDGAQLSSALHFRKMYPHHWTRLPAMDSFQITVQ